MQNALKLGILATSVCLGLVALEITARCVMPSASPRHILDHPVLNHVWRPNSTYEHSEFVDEGVPPYTHHYNGAGFISSRHLPLEKPFSEFRIFVVGDSFIEGTVPMEQSMPSVLQEQLAPIFKERGQSVNVVNAGISSYSPLLHYLLITKYLLPYKPDFVIVAIDMTDVFDDYLYQSVAVTGPDGDFVAVPANTEFSKRYERTARGLRERTWWERQLLPLFPYSRLLQFISVAKSVRAAQAVDMPGLFDWCTDEKEFGKLQPPTERSVAFSMSMLRKLSSTLRAAGIRLVVTAVPHLEQFQGTWSIEPLKTVEKTCANLEEPYFDTFAALKRSLEAGESPEVLYMKRDMHFSARGYRAWGQGLAKMVEGLVGE